MNRKIRIKRHANVDMEERDAEARAEAFHAGWTEGHDNANKEAISAIQRQFNKTLRQRNSLADLATRALNLLVLAARDRQWEPNRFVRLGDLILVDNALWKCSTAGRTGGTPPNWLPKSYPSSRSGFTSIGAIEREPGYTLHDREARWMLCHRDLEALIGRLNDEESDMITTLLDSINGDQVNDNQTPPSADTDGDSISTPSTIQAFQRFGEAVENAAQPPTLEAFERFSEAVENAQANIANAFQVPRRILNHDED